MPEKSKRRARLTLSERLSPLDAQIARLEQELAGKRNVRAALIAEEQQRLERLRADLAAASNAEVPR